MEADRHLLRRLEVLPAAVEVRGPPGAAVHCREYELGVDPTRLAGERLLRLLGAVGTERVNDDARQGDAPPALGCLRFLEDHLAVGLLEGLVHDCLLYT